MVLQRFTAAARDHTYTYMYVPTRCWSVEGVDSTTRYGTPASKPLSFRCDEEQETTSIGLVSLVLFLHRVEQLVGIDSVISSKVCGTPLGTLKR